MRELSLYAVLGVKTSATAAQIRQAYRDRARLLHPDVNQSIDATEKFAQLQRAYETLSDTKKRRAYDQRGKPPASVPKNGSAATPHYAWSNIAAAPGEKKRKGAAKGKAASAGGDEGDPTGFEEMYQAFFVPRHTSRKARN